MTTVRTREGEWIHFPSDFTNSLSSIEPPSDEELSAIAAALHHSDLLLFAKRLIHGAHRRRCNPRWSRVNVSRLQLAKLCIDRIIGQDAPPADHAAEAA